MLLGRTQLVEQIEGVIDDPVRPRTGTIDLVDDDDRLESLRQRLARDEARLRHRPFDRVDQQQHAVDHRQHALDLAAEIRVARRVDDVDVRAFVVDRAVLREDRDAALALEIVGIHDPLGHLLVLAEGSGLPQQLVDQRGLAVVDVRDDGDVAQWALHDGSFSFDISRSGATTPHSLTFAVPSSSSRGCVHPDPRTARLGVDRQPLSLPKARGEVFIQIDSRQRAEQFVHRQQDQPSLGERNLFQLLQRHGVVQAERADARSTQRDQMRTASEFAPDVLSQHAHIGALAAFHVQRHLISRARNALQTRDHDTARRTQDLYTRPREFIQRPPFALQRRMHRRHLRDAASEA